MARGGKRPNAGRKPGEMTKARKAVLDRARAATNEGETPLEYMLRVMRTSNDDKRRDAMAQAAAPYVHNRLASIEHKGDEESPLNIISRIELVAP
jgi:hypothetical protein